MENNNKSSLPEQENIEEINTPKRKDGMADVDIIGIIEDEEQNSFAAIVDKSKQQVRSICP